MSIMTLAFIGGIISAISTSAGSLVAPLFTKIEKLRKYSLSMDFALGVMLSAVAFSLVGPEIMKGQHLQKVFLGLFIGMLFIYFTHKIISYLSHESKQSGKMLLIAALIFHNFPEGMGAGASLAGMEMHQAIPIQIAISIQNVAEGLLLTLLLQSMGLSLFYSVLGGIGSGLLEMTGAISAGAMLEQIENLLPLLLSLAGGAMIMSVGLEVKEKIQLHQGIERSHFLWGLLTIPVSNYFFS
jgi:ZIP family zinc transporter